MNGNDNRREITAVSLSTPMVLSPISCKLAKRGLALAASIERHRIEDRPPKAVGPHGMSTLKDYTGMTVLITDDDNRLTKTMATLIKQYFPGINIEIANDGVEALDHINRRPPSLLILGMMMPRMGGAEVLRELWKRGLRIPVFTMSGYLSSKDRVAELAGVPIHSFEHAAKPFNLEILIDSVQRLLSATPKRSERGHKDDDIGAFPKK